MLFEWDDKKRFLNFEKHKIDFADAIQLFKNPYLTKEDKRKDYGEKRWIALGIIKNGIVVVVFTYIKHTIRIISARKANKIERNIYHEKFKKHG
jgi:uncharacterized DUF497 family protein